MEASKVDAVTATTQSHRAVNLLPPVELEVHGSDGDRLNTVATTAVSDLESFWAVEYPKMYGDKYEPLSGGLFAYGPTTDPKSLPCPADTIDAMLGNAFYCPDADAVAWDQDTLLPTLAKDYGDFAVAIVLSHEWGHVIQQRAGVFDSSVHTELQADCMAGAWVAHVHDATSTHFVVDAEVLDKSLAGILSLKDSPGVTADDPTAHGSGFDRISAFQDGYKNGAPTCRDYVDGKVKPYQFPFLSQTDIDNGGNLSLDDTVDALGNRIPGIKSQAVAALEDYWAKEFPQLGGGSWKRLAKPVEFDRRHPPSCDGTVVESYRLFLCEPERWIGYSTDLLDQAYRTYGDFGVATLIGTQYGLEVQVALDDVPDDGVLMTLRGDCYSGAWTAALIPDEYGSAADGDLGLVLSPGDLDEAVGVLLGIRSESDRDRQGPGFDRVRAFRTGVVDGPEACRSLKR